MYRWSGNSHFHGFPRQITMRVAHKLLVLYKAGIYGGVSSESSAALEIKRAT